MKIRKTGMTLVLVLALALATAAFAYGRGATKGERGQAPWDRAEVISELGLTDAQVTALKESGESFRSDMKDLHDQIRDAREAHRDLLESDNFNEAQFRSSTNDLADLMAQRVRLHGEHMIQVRGILSAEQFSKLEAMRPERGEMRQRMRGMDRMDRQAPPDADDEGPDVDW